MFDIKQLDSTYTDPQDQLLIALGVHPDQKAAQQAVAAAQGNSASLTGAIPSTVTNLTTDPNTGQKTYSEDHGKTWKPLGPAAAPAPSVAPIARPNGAMPILLPEQRQAAASTAPDTAAVTPASPQISTSSAAPVSLAAPGTTEQAERPTIARPGDVGKTAALNMTEPKPDEGVRLIPPSAASDTQAISSATAEPGTDTPLAAEQAELQRKRVTGSGVSQIKNPFLRAAARIGDVALTTMFPSVAVQVPGTELHHRELLHQDQAQINNDLATQEKSAEITQKGALADQELAKAWQLKHPAAKMPKVLFDSGVPYAIQQGENEYVIGGTNMPPDLAPLGASAIAAHKQRLQEQQDAQNNKPDTATQNKQQFQDIGAALAKEMDGNMPKDFYTNPATQAKIVNASKTLTPEQKQFFVGYSLANPTPASQALNVVLRGETYAAGRPVKVYDNVRHETRTVSLAENERADKEEPGRYTSPDYTPAAIMEKTVAKDLAGGKMKDQIVSFNTLLYHIGDANDGIDEIRNTKSPLINKPLNWLRGNAMGDPNVSNLIQRYEPVKKEFESFLLNNRAMYAEDRESVNKILNENMSPAQMQEAMKQFAHTAALRLGTQNDAYKRANRGKDIPDLVNPQAQMLLDKYGVKVPGYNGGTAQDTTAPAPQGMINVQIPGQPPGHIPASARKQFLQDNPGAKVID